MLIISQCHLTKHRHFCNPAGNCRLAFSCPDRDLRKNNDASLSSREHHTQCWPDRNTIQNRQCLILVTMKGQNIKNTNFILAKLYKVKHLTYLYIAIVSKLFEYAIIVVISWNCMHWLMLTNVTYCSNSVSEKNQLSVNSKIQN